MRYVYSAAVLITLAALIPGSGNAQLSARDLTVTNYQILNEQRLTRDQSQYTYRADLVNSGAVAVPALTATVTSLSPSIQVLPGQGNLHFGPVAAGGRVTSLTTFMVIVDRSGDADFSNLQWSFTSPVANAGPNQTALIGSTVTLNASGSTNPSGIGSLTYNWAFSSRPPGTRVVLQNATGVMPTFVPDVNGDYVFLLTVSNGVGSDTSSVTVSTNGSKPVADAGPPQTVKQGATVTLNGSKSNNVDGLPLTYAWKLILAPANSQANLTGAITVSPTFVADQVGTYMVQLIVSDANGSSDPSVVTITTTNSVPVANAGPNQSVNVGATVQLDGSRSTDVDGDPLTYRWTLITVPAGSQAAPLPVAMVTLVNPKFTADVAGIYVAQLIVNDGFADSAPVTVAISTNTVQAPTANAGPAQSLAHGSTVTLNGSGTDPQQLPLTYHWSLVGLPMGSVAVLSNPNTATPSFFADLPGTYIAQLIVTDSAMLSSNPATVTISSTNTAPVANAGPNLNVATGSTVTLDGSGSSDAENDKLTYSWSLTSVPPGSNAMSTFLSPNIVSPTFVADVAGTYVAQLIVNDGFLNSTPSTVTITAAFNAIGLTPNPLNLFSAPDNLTVTIAQPAGSGGQVIKLFALDPTVATVPATVTIAQGATSALASVTPAGLGSTTVLASASGFQPGTATINVGQPVIALSLNLNNIGIGKTAVGTITLNSPAPAAGTMVQLSADRNGVVNIPSSVTVAGGTTGTFTITGAGVGVVNITASAPGFTSGSAALTVAQSGAIAVQSNLTVAPGQTLPINISLISAAPAGGVTINLVSGDTSKLTVSPSVFIAQGSTTPANPAQVTGVNFGSTTVAASATGFTGDTETVQIAANLSFAPLVLTAPLGGNGLLTLTLSGPAPAGGITVNLSSDTPGVASVPVSVNFAQGATSVPVQVNGLTLGSANISAVSTIPGVASASAKVNVIAGVVIATSSLPAGVAGTPYNVTVTATGGTGPYTFSATGLPANLSISTGGQITGTPSGASSGTVSITATDSTPGTHLTGTLSLPLTISGPLAISTTSLPNGTVGSAYSANVAAAGGNPAYTFSATGLPSGLTINGAGVISGTPTSPGNSTVVVTVTDSTNPTHVVVNASFPVTINSALAITTSSLPTATVGTPYNQSVAATGGQGPYTFTATGLPAGLSLSAGGAITGTPSVNGASTVNITVTDQTSPTHLTASANLTLAVVPPALSITTSSLPNGATGSAYNATVSATGGTPGYTFSATGLPAGLSISAGGQITGTPSVVGPSTVAVTVTDSTNPTHLTATANLNITIVPPNLAVATTSLPGATVGVAYSAQVGATGGVPQYSFSATGLPNGLNMNTAGLITGTPTAAGPSTVTVTVNDSASPHATATANITLTVAPAPVVINQTPLPGGTVGVAYNASVSATGGTLPYSFTASGLPAGFTMNTAGQITGSPTTAGVSSVTVNLSDATNPTHLTATATFSITIAPPPVTFVTTSLPAGTVGVPYNASVTATGGTPGYSFLANGLPAGLTMSTGGQITGTPISAGTSTTNFNVSDSTSPTHLTATTSLSIVIAPAPVAVSTTPLPNGTVGVNYSATVSASGGTPGYTFSAPGLPAGLTISSGGQITGTPSATGTTSFVVTATDSTNPTHLTGTATLSITILPPVLAIATTSLPAGVVGVVYNASVGASGGTQPYAFLATGLPNGLTMNGAGQISGTPTTAGVSTVTVSVTDAATPKGSATANLTITIAPPPLTFVTASLPSGIVGTSYTANVSASGGVGPYNFTATGLPAGLSLSLNGQITGTPTVTGTIPVTFTVTDSAVPAHQMVSSTINIVITAPPLVINTSSLPNGTQGLPYSATLSASGGTAPFNWTVQAGTLPSGLSLDPVSGAITGTPTVAGSSSLTFRVTDSSNPLQGVSTSLSLTITPQITGPTLVITSATVGQNLQVPVSISFLMPNPGNVDVTVSSDNPDVLLTSNPGNLGTATFTLSRANPALSPFIIFAQSQGGSSSGTANLTVTAPGYANGTSVITIGPSGFVLSGPNGVGGSLNSNQGATTPLSVTSELLDGSGNPIQSQQLRGNSHLILAPDGVSMVLSAEQVDAVVNLSNSNSAIGSIPASVSLLGGTNTVSFNFIAGSTVANGLITAVPPTGYATPANSTNVIPVTVHQTFISPSNATVGFGLETNANVTLGSVPSSDVLLTLTSNDPTKLLLSTSPTAAGVATICPDLTCSMKLTIRAGHTVSPDFYVYGLASSGTVTYTVSTPSFPNGTANGVVTLTKSGFLISGPFGSGQNFFTTVGSQDSEIDLLTAMLDANGNFVSSQALAGGGSVSVNVTSSSPSIGTIAGPAIIPAGSTVGSTTFHPVAAGVTVLTAVPPAGFVTPASGGSLSATVRTPNLLIGTGSGVVGHNLELQGTIFLGSGAPSGGLTVNLGSDNTSGLAFSKTATGTGSPTLTLTVPAGSSSATFFMYGLNDIGTANITATATGFTSGSASVTLAPAGITIVGPFGPTYPLDLSAGTSAPVSVSPSVLDAGGNAIMTQSLAGGQTLSVSLSVDDTSVGTIASPVTIAAGSDTAVAQFTASPTASGRSSIIRLARSSNFTPDNSMSLIVNVQ